jgi:hypothetical protein
VTANVTTRPFILFAYLMLSPARKLFEQLSPDSRSAISEVADYYCLQVTNSNQVDFPSLLSKVRESFSCLALVGQLSAQVRSELLYVAPHLLSSRSVPDPFDDDSVISLVLPELALWVASARLGGEDFDGDLSGEHAISSRNLPDYEFFRRGDLVHVRDRASDHFGRTGWFRGYSDPRIGNLVRSAQVEFRRPIPEGEVARRETAELPPAALQFAPEPYANEHGDMHLRTLVREGFEVRLFDTGRTSRQGKILLHYQLFDHRFEDGIEPIFENTDFLVSPLHAPDEDATLASLLTFLSLRRGDIEAGHFEGYTTRQLAWRDERAGDLAMLALELEESSRTEDCD